MAELTYFVLTRLIFDSPIWADDPHRLKLFIYLVGNARYSKRPKRLPNVTIRRGELVRSLKQISDDNAYTKQGHLKHWSRAKVSRMLHHLQDKKYIIILSDTYGTHIKICNYDFYQSQATYKAKTSEAPKPSQLVEDVILYFNQVSGKKFSAKSKNTIGNINARASEGHSLDAFKTVIDNKTASWLNHPKYNKFLRPETLFCPKHFESYLNEKPKTKTQAAFSETTRENMDVLDGWGVE